MFYSGGKYRMRLAISKQVIQHCFLFFGACLLSIQTFAQDDTAGRLDEKIDELTYAWDLEADKLSSYEGLQNLCADQAYRKEIFKLLEDIHHYDTVLYGVLLKLSHSSKDREINKTLKEIKRFEEQYDTKSFIHYMREECVTMLEIEKNAEDSRNEVGYSSYSSQVYMLETELVKYVKHITKRVDKIREHVHHLSGHYRN